MPSITMACNIYNECNAVHGLLESASQFFDELFFFHTGPGGKYSDDGTIEILEKWGVRLEFGSLDAGFGAVRTDLIHRSKCEWVMIMDADERFYPWVPVPSVEGGEKYPEVQKPNLKVTPNLQINQAELLRSLIVRPEFDVIRTCRRHWFDHTWTRPCQNWFDIADWQCRIVRNNGKIGYDTSIRMHERLIGFEDHRMWKWNESQQRGPYHDHFHCWYKPMETEQRKQDIRYYDWLHSGSVSPFACHTNPQ